MTRPTPKPRCKVLAEVWVAVDAGTGELRKDSDGLLIVCVDPQVIGGYSDELVIRAQLVEVPERKKRGTR